MVNDIVKLISKANVKRTLVSYVKLRYYYLKIYIEIKYIFYNKFFKSSLNDQYTSVIELYRDILNINNLITCGFIKEKYKFDLVKFFTVINSRETSIHLVRFTDKSGTINITNTIYPNIYSLDLIIDRKSSDFLLSKQYIIDTSTLSKKYDANLNEIFKKFLKLYIGMILYIIKSITNNTTEV